MIKTYCFDRKQCGVLDAVCKNDNNDKNTVRFYGNIVAPKCCG